MVGGAVYLMLVGIFALGIGAIVRNTAGGIATFAGIFFVVPPLMSILPASWNDAISKYLPSDAGGQIFSLTRDAHSLSPWRAGCSSSATARLRSRSRRSWSSGATRDAVAT